MQRITEVFYQERKWFKWTRECQDEEEKLRENEQKKIKREAGLFRRQAKELEVRMRELRAMEDARRQEEFLEKTYQDNFASRLNTADDDSDWDPIEDIIENERGTYIQLIRHFLWLEEQQESASHEASDETKESTADTPATPLAETTNTANTPTAAREGADRHNGKRKTKGKGKAPTTVAGTPKSQTLPSQKSQRDAPVVVRQQTEKKKLDDEPNMTRIEGQQEMRERLLSGTKPMGDGIKSVRMDGSFLEFEGMPPMPADETDRIIGQVAEIKNYLFCRLLLNNAVLLPAALKAETLDQFFESNEVKAQELRDLCLRLEQPQLQEIRDACADFFSREDEMNRRETIQLGRRGRRQRF